jgi:hypothetical protein
LEGLPATASGAVINGPMAWPGSTAGNVELHWGNVETPFSIGRLVGAVVPQGAVEELFDV